jgi:hypothetical protein
MVQTIVTRGLYADVKRLGNDAAAAAAADSSRERQEPSRMLGTADTRKHQV